MQAGDRQLLAEMMESVEDIPADSIMEGLAWDWETYGEYLDAVDRMPKGINVGGMVGHCAVRFHAMGERGLDEDARDRRGHRRDVRPRRRGDDAGRARLLDVADAAAPRARRSAGPRHVRRPDELLAIAEVLGGRGRGRVRGRARARRARHGRRAAHAPEVAWMGEVSRRTGRPVTFGLSPVEHACPDHYHAIDRPSEGSRTRLGRDLRPQTTARGIGILFGPACRTPFDRSPAWKALRDLPLRREARRAARPARRAELIAAAEADADDPDWTELYVLPTGDARYDLPARRHARCRRGAPPR